MSVKFSDQKGKIKKFERLKIIHVLFEFCFFGLSVFEYKKT